MGGSCREWTWTTPRLSPTCWTVSVQIPDVNVLVYAHREDADRHVEYLAWLRRIVGGPGAYGLADLVLSGFLRVVTHPRVFRSPSRLTDALAFAQELRSQPSCVTVSPGIRHWGIFTELCRSAEPRGNLVPDAYLAALAIEHGAEWVTTDRDFSRFPGLRWRHPLSATGGP